jgi:hypothetical protein
MNSFTSKDILQIQNCGLRTGDVESHLALYRRGPNFLKLDRPCIPGDGILPVTQTQRNRLIRKFENEAAKYELLKFVPASGAASRMFADWFTAADQGGFGSLKSDRSFLQDLKKMPFYLLIKNNGYGRDLLQQKNIKGLLDFILSASGLNYGWLPKALITFHSYKKKEQRAALEEHLCEAASYLRCEGHSCRLHLTVSSEHVGIVDDKIKELRKKYESLLDVKYIIGLSTQSSATDKLAVDENDQPFRDAGGRLVFRPGGHGALLKNLGDQEADFIFIKNIDNIVPSGFLEKILPYKKMLGGLALQIQEEIFTILENMEKRSFGHDQIDAVKIFCMRKLNIVFPPQFARWSKMKKNQHIFSLLNRPLRICGMVRNVGEPGGGPFWITEADGLQTVQIVESAHVDKTDPGQLSIWHQAKYFNPVDMVCCIRNHRGEKFDLNGFVDNDAYLISIKTEKGKKLKVQELPGLWNGGMAHWNTVFTELPLAAFNPVKTVYDLLRPEHQIL